MQCKQASVVVELTSDGTVDERQRAHCVRGCVFKWGKNEVYVKRKGNYDTMTQRKQRGGGKSSNINMAVGEAMRATINGGPHKHSGCPDEQRKEQLTHFFFSPIPVTLHHIQRCATNQAKKTKTNKRNKTAEQIK